LLWGHFGGSNSKLGTIGDSKPRQRPIARPVFKLVWIAKS